MEEEKRNILGLQYSLNQIKEEMKGMNKWKKLMEELLGEIKGRY